MHYMFFLWLAQAYHQLGLQLFYPQKKDITQQNLAQTNPKRLLNLYPYTNLTKPSLLQIFRDQQSIFWIPIPEKQQCLSQNCRNIDMLRGPCNVPKKTLEALHVPCINISSIRLATLLFSQKAKLMPKYQQTRISQNKTWAKILLYLHPYTECHKTKSSPNNICACIHLLVMLRPESNRSMTTRNDPRIHSCLCRSIRTPWRDLYT